MKINTRTVLTVAVIAALVNVGMSHLAAQRAGG